MGQGLESFASVWLVVCHLEHPSSQVLGQGHVVAADAQNSQVVIEIEVAHLRNCRQPPYPVTADVLIVTIEA